MCSDKGRRSQETEERQNDAKVAASQGRRRSQDSLVGGSPGKIRKKKEKKRKHDEAGRRPSHNPGNEVSQYLTAGQDTRTSVSDGEYASQSAQPAVHELALQIGKIQLKRYMYEQQTSGVCL